MLGLPERYGQVALCSSLYLNQHMETLALLKSGQLLGQKELKISAALTEFPMEILDLADSLELLVLSNNRLSSLPEEFSQLKKLRIVFFNNNAFETFPTVLAKCPNLSMISFKGNSISTIEAGLLSPAIRWLILTDNCLETLPADVGTLSKLKKLMLAGNRLQSLPVEMKNCQSLELIRLSANQLRALPRWLFSLPRLSWLAYAGNPFCNTEAFLKKRSAFETTLPVIQEDALEIGEVLGQGASGIIYKAVWTDKKMESRTVAVKLFKGEMTSDGLPADEMHACMGAGEHPNLVRVLGQLGGQKSGLIFSFIPSDYRNLGGPPSLETCTRDTYGSEVSFALPMVLKVASGIASAVNHLHARGVTHGDLYAHNILIDEIGESILGDFGAASFYDATDLDLGELLEQMESRAFGCLLEDLLVRCSDSGVSVDSLWRLQQDCMSPEPAQRPTFSKICERLGSEIGSEISTAL